MIKYAPIIDTSVPGFLMRNECTADNLIVHFKHNIAVSKADVAAIQVVLKPYSSISQTAIIAQGQTEEEGSYYDLDKGVLVIKSLSLTNETSSVFSEGTYYKVQIAYIDHQGNPGPYSSVGITRCLGYKGETGLFIEGLIKDTINVPQRSYVGVFNRNTSIVEPIYQYRFYLQNTQTEEMVQDSGWVSPLTDAFDRPIMIFNVAEDLEKNIRYKLHLEVTTINGYSTAISYDIEGSIQEYPNTYKGLVIAEQDRYAKDNGYAVIKLSSSSNFDIPNGSFILLRREITSRIWEELTSFSLTNMDNLNKYEWKDFTIEAGKTYLYAIQQWYEDSITKKRIYSDKAIAVAPITAEFEDMFLSDGEKQLRIAFDPKVSSFKTTILEQKTDTIGGKYPIFSRNGQVAYRELPISGLISYQMDPNFLFIKHNELGLMDLNNAKTSVAIGTTPIEIQGLNINQINKNLYYYTSSGNFDEVGQGQIVAYRYRVWDVEKPEENLSGHFWTPPKRDADGKPVMDFTLRQDLLNDKAYCICLEIKTTQNKLYTTSTYIIANRAATATHNLTYENFNLEKQFKMLVYDWLNNGQPKFFRSPAEGNYILRLMSVSLSPNETVARMLHSFSATGYEIAECSIAELQKRSLAICEMPNDIEQYATKSIKQTYVINKTDNVVYTPIVIMNPNQTTTIRCTSAIPNGTMWLKKGEPYEQTSYLRPLTASANVVLQLFDESYTKPFTLIVDNSKLSGTITVETTYTRPTETNIFNNKAKYSSIRDITLSATNSWDDQFYCEQQCNKQGEEHLLKSYLQLERLFKIKSIRPVDGSTNYGCIIYLANGTSLTCGTNSIADFFITDLQHLENYDEIVKIEPFANTEIVLTGLISHATSAQLGHFAVGNSRLGDDYIG